MPTTDCPKCKTTLRECPSCGRLRCACPGNGEVGLHWRDGVPMRFKEATLPPKTILELRAERMNYLRRREMAERA